MAKILVIDDDEATLCYTTEVLEIDKHTIKTSQNALVAYLVAEMEPDLILMDVSISSSSQGDMAVKALQKLSTVKERTKIVLYSSFANSKLEKLVHSCGADGYICKTGNSEELRRRVAYFLNLPKAILRN